VTINDQQLPATFLAISADILSSRLSDIWELKGEVDAYGYPWEADLWLDGKWTSWQQDTASLPSSFLPENNADESFMAQPGFIPWIGDFSQIVCFGRDGKGDEYCFDFRDNSDNPSVIHWSSGYWRRVAPDFETFLTLFEPTWEDRSSTWTSLRRRTPSGRKSKKARAIVKVQQPDQHAYAEWCGSGRVVDAIVEVLTVAKSFLGRGATIDQVIDLVRHQKGFYQSIIEDAVADPK
jgi:hypothetical protein